MSECKYGVVTGTPTYDGCEGLSQQDCINHTGPWGWSCCWYKVPTAECLTRGCAGLSNPDECPGCNRCEDDGVLPAFWGWEITDNRGTLNQTVYDEGELGILPLSNGYIRIEGDDVIHCAGIEMYWIDTPNTVLSDLRSGGTIYVYGSGRVP